VIALSALILLQAQSVQVLLSSGYFVFAPPVGCNNTAMSVFVCLSVLWYISKTTRPNLTKNFLYMFSGAVDWSFLTSLECVMYFRFCR